MARKWKAGGQELYDDQVPFAAGTPEYYRYIANWRAKALGVSYGGVGPGDWEAPDGGDEKYKQGLKDWWDRQIAETRMADRGNLDAPAIGPDAGWYEAAYKQAKDNGWGGLNAAGYVRDAGGLFRDLNGNGSLDANEAYGKYQNPAMGYDNSWSEVDGADPRTDEQKFYDRDLEDFEQIADANGTYNWYANWQYRDKDGNTEKKRLNLTYLGDRDGRDDQGNDIVGSGLNYARDKETANYSGHDYYKYNGARDKSWFTEQVRNRKNLSPYARTA